MTPINIKVSKSKVIVKGQDFSRYVRDVGHEWITKIYFLQSNIIFND